MIEFNKIPSDSIWGAICSFINANFEKIRIELMKLSHASIKVFNKGYFSSEIKLLNRWPKPEIGWYAFVGSPWPGKVYECATAGTWTNTNTSPVIGDDVFIQMLKYYIDNDTIYWDDAKKVIKAKGGGGGEPEEETFTISVGINPADIGKCDVDATGDYLSVVPSADGSSYTVTAKKGGTVTVKILSNNGYTVSKLNVDKSPQGSSDSYTFKNIDADHTMYVWMEVAAEEIPTDFLLRSDKPGAYYSSTHVALNAIKADYPNGLTKDVTLSCVKKAKERRLANDGNKLTNERIYLSVLHGWNKGSMFTLTIDGCGLLTYDCASLGGLRFKDVDNVIIRDTSFVNYANFVDASTPEECAAVMFLGSDTDYGRNLSIWNCTFDGISTTNNSTCSTYTLSTKYTENVCVQGSEFKNNAGLTFYMTNSRFASIVKNSISGKFRSGAVGHAGFFNINNGYQVILEDNNIDGKTFYETLMYFSNIDNIYLRRNNIHDGAEIASLSANLNIKNLIVEDNLMVNMLMNPMFAWTHDYFYSTAYIVNFVFNNNTVWMGGNDYMQFIIRFDATDTRNIKIYNNIVVDPDTSLSSSKINLFNFKTAGALSMGNNLFKVSIKDASRGQTYGEIVAVANPDASPDSITASGDNARLLSYLRSKGYDQNTILVAKTNKLLDIEAGGNSYAITSGYDGQYPADNSQLPDIDYLYRKKSAELNSCGCYNLHGEVINESNDSATGYTGENLSEAQSFSNAAQYVTPADSLLAMTHNTLNRSRLIKWKAEGTQHSSIALGKYALLHALPVVDENGEFTNEELYNINIE